MKKKLRFLLTPFLGLMRLIAKPFGYLVVSKKSTLDFVLYEYSSYEEYKQTQINFNQKKIENVWADPKTLNRVIEILSNSFDKQNEILGLCHGTRNGYEQDYFNSADKGISAIGTDISPTASNFANSYQWDFHEFKKEWKGKFDFIYTNSLDQSWKPKEALTVWLDQLNPKGLLVIEHTQGHSPMNSSKMDPFGVRPEAMPYVLTMWFGSQISISHSVDIKSNYKNQAWLFVISKNKENITPF